MPLSNAFADLATEPTLAAIFTAVDGLESRLDALLVELLQKYEGGAVALDPASLAALETVTIANPTANPETGLAKDVKLDLVLAKLVDIYAAVDGLEVTAGNIEISADTINLQTDEVEALLQTVRDRLPAALDGDGGVKVHLQNPDALTNTQLRAVAVPVSGTVVANLGTIDGVATEASLAHSKNKFAPGLRTTVAGYVATVGNNTILTPAAGKKLRVHWIGMSASQDNVGENLVVIKFGTSGAAKYRWRMGNPGAFSHWEPIEGAVDEVLVLNLTTVDGIDWNCTYEEI